MGTWMWGKVVAEELHWYKLLYWRAGARQYSAFLRPTWSATYIAYIHHIRISMRYYPIVCSLDAFISGVLLDSPVVPFVCEEFSLALRSTSVSCIVSHSICLFEYHHLFSVRFMVFSSYTYEHLRPFELFSKNVHKKSLRTFDNEHHSYICALKRVRTWTPIVSSVSLQNLKRCLGERLWCNNLTE